MGYKHYWYRHKRIPTALFRIIHQDMLRGLEYLSGKKFNIKYWGLCFITLYGVDGKEPFQVYADRIIFNGDGGRELNYRTFDFPQVLELQSCHTARPHGLYRNSCATARKPYDLAVCLCLLIAKFHLKNQLILEEPDWDEPYFNDGSNWDLARQLFTEIMGADADNELDVLMAFN